MDEFEARKLIVEIGRLLYERSYVVASDGNVSIRLSDDRILATPTMMCKGRMTEADLALTDMDGKAVSDQRASSELAMHLLIYKMRPDVKAVCHAHPPNGTAFAVAGLAIDQPILSEVILTLGCVPLTDYGTPSTDELTDSMKPYVEHHNALLMANHGAVAYGETLWQAFDRLETLEHTAKIAILAKTLGGANDLPRGAIEKLIEIREKAGYLKANARCQACGYLHETGISCDLQVSYPDQNSSNGKKISFTREELIELLSQAAKLG
jgi:L-fuculose-phosphate aldolase